MDSRYMELALELAKKGIGKVNPNPMVGAVVVKNGRIIGEGYHEEYGKAHAEVNALMNLSESAVGAIIYVTLEPCFHFGKTPPCVDLIIKKGVTKVVIGSLDPNPLVAGKSIKKLRSFGIEVITGVLEKECNKLNEVFIKYIQNKRPFVVLKSAMSLDGKIATCSGESQWITGEVSRARVHGLRNELSGIMVGVNTVIVDNPKLTCRIESSRNPMRIVVDSKLRIPLQSNVIVDEFKDKTIIATTKEGDKEKLEILKEKGIRVIITKINNGKVDLDDLVVKLGALNIDGILLEGGSELAFSAINQGIVDKVQFYIAPKIIGGKEAKTAVEGQGIGLLKDAFKVKKMETSIIGDDILIEGYL